MTARPVLEGITFRLGDGITVEGYRGSRPQKYRARLLHARLSPTGKVVEFTFEGPRWVTKWNGWHHRPVRFWSDDPALNEAKLTARRVAATAATRTLTGAK